MRLVKYALAATILAAPMLAMAMPAAKAATAAEYSAKGHGRTPIMRKNPSREIYRRNNPMYRHHHMRRMHRMHRM